MRPLNELLKELNFTKYEAQALSALIEFRILDAKELSKKSGVPQPKIYETLDKLETKGLVSVKTEQNKKIFLVKPRKTLRKKILEYPQELMEMAERSIERMEETYGTQELSFDYPFIGFAGMDSAQESILSLIQLANKEIILFLPLNMIDDRITEALDQKGKNISVKLIAQDEEELGDLVEKLPNVELYQLKTPAFDLIKMMMKGVIEKKIPKEAKEGFSFKIIKDVAENAKNIFGIMLVDRLKSFFRIPLPLETPMVIVSTLPEIVDFHSRGLDAILDTSVPFPWQGTLTLWNPPHSPFDDNEKL